jgi:flagellar assembly protein FliH
MSSIIRATERNRGTQTAAFNLNDMAVKAEQQLEKFRAEAAKIVAQARQQAEAIRRQAERDGHQAGIQSVERIVQKQLATVLPGLQKAVQDIQHAKQAWLAQWEASAIHLAVLIAQRLVRRELTDRPEIPITLVREALELAAGNSRLRIYINDKDHKAIASQVELLVKELAGLAEAEIVPDPDITPGGCRLETQFGTIDQQFEAQLRRIEEELT